MKKLSLTKISELFIIDLAKSHSINLSKFEFKNLKILSFLIW
jgi:hypothetical protein